MVAFHHVNLGVHPGGVDEETSFLVDVLGYERLSTPKELTGRNVNWYRANDGSEIHLSEDPEHRPAARAHVAVVLGEAFDAVVEKLRVRGTALEVYEGSIGGHVAMCRDPAGNRWELRAG